MFQYTTETIINSNTGNLIGGKRFGIYPADGGITEDPAETANPTDFFLIDGVNTFKIKNITAIYKSPYRQAVKATALLTAPNSITEGDVVRLTVTLREEGSVRSSLQNAYLHKTKPFHYEVKAAQTEVAPEDTSNATNNAKLLMGDIAKLVKKDMAMTDFDYFTVAEANGTITLTAKDCYVQFADVKLEKVIENAAAYNQTRTEKLEGFTATITRGDEGAGTVARIIKNLRIPTNASINPFSADQGGLPIPGGKYDQYLIEYTTDRRHVAGTVVGSLDRSITSHVFFVEQGCEDWATVIDVVAEAAKVKVEDDQKVIIAGKGLTVNEGGSFTEVDPKNGNVEVDTTEGTVKLEKTSEMGSVE